MILLTINVPTTTVPIPISKGAPAVLPTAAARTPPTLAPIIALVTPRAKDFVKSSPLTIFIVVLRIALFFPTKILRAIPPLAPTFSA